MSTEKVAKEDDKSCKLENVVKLGFLWSPKSEKRGQHEKLKRRHQKTCLADQCCLLYSSFSIPSSQKRGVASSIIEKQKHKECLHLLYLHELTVSPHLSSGQNIKRETFIESLQMEWCFPSHQGKSHHSWCGTGNDTCLRKLSTMTVHWSFFFKYRQSLFLWEQVCLCLDVAINGKYFRVPWKQLHTYILNPSTHDYHVSFLSAQGQDSGTEG